MLDPDALRLDVKSSEHLVGRKEDIERVLKALDHPLVFLVGESGSGKSALLRAGLQPHPETLDRFIPVPLDLAGLDWEEGPLRALADTFWRSLDADTRTKLGLQRPPELGDLGKVFESAYTALGRRPLLLLDQFDDYQARHRERFLPAASQLWLLPEQLVEVNAFWDGLRTLLAGRSIYLLIVTRDDTAAGLSSVSFSPPGSRSYILERLKSGFLHQLLDRLTVRKPDQSQVIANPEGGWDRLRDRLVADLEARGAVLPQQLKVVLGGLRALWNRLTVASYEKAGALAGLESAFVGSGLAAAARVSSLPEATVLRLALALVDRERQPPAKAAPRTATELAAAIGVPAPAVIQALGSLARDDVLRPRGDEAAVDTPWQLDHDYLAGPILRLERERDRWRVLLAERAAPFRDAGLAPARFWRSLLPLREQLWLLLARCGGRFRYGEYRGYAAFSCYAFCRQWRRWHFWAAPCGVFSNMIGRSGFAAVSS